MVVLEPLNKTAAGEVESAHPQVLLQLPVLLDLHVHLHRAVTYHQPALEKARQGGASSWGGLLETTLAEDGARIITHPADADRWVLQPRANLAGHSMEVTA